MSVGDDPFSPLSIRASSRHSSNPIVSFRLTIDLRPCYASQKEQSTKLDRFSLSIRQHDREGTWTAQDRTRETGYYSPSFSSPDSDYSPGLDQVLVG